MGRSQIAGQAKNHKDGSFCLDVDYGSSQYKQYYLRFETLNYWKLLARNFSELYEQGKVLRFRI